MLENLDYFHDLGVHFLYFSPITKAVRGSLHGYDGVDFETVNPEIGTEGELEELALSLHKRGMGILLDIVPNHMSRTAENKWWRDVESNGKKSPYHEYFDMDWDSEGNIAFFRRFFDISDLISLRIEEPHLFEAVHRLPFRWLEKGWIQGLRIDHIDGLSDPQKYLNQIAPQNCYLIVEKILVGEETLPASWPVEGTTGYDFLNHVNGLFVHPEGYEALRTIYASFTKGTVQEMEQVIATSKREILETSLKPELDRLFGFYPSSDTLSLLSYFPVYRTYITADEPISARDWAILQKGFGDASLENSPLQPLFFEKQNLPYIQFFQQLSGPAMAKGCEDTALYRYYPLASVNEVGMDPAHPWNSATRFHEQNLERRPHTLLTTSTHDTKRSEDVRARINVLSEVVVEWEESIKCWSKRNPFEDPNIEYLIYQTLLGTWGKGEDFEKRIQAYILKAIKEAKLHTHWVNPNPIYEDQVHAWIAKLLADPQFCQEMQAWYERVEEAGKLNSLGQLILKATVPGVPDFYQGQEEWQWTLVDPDNRQFIDYQSLNPSHRKQSITRALLHLRNEHPLLFQEGSYHPIPVKIGIGFARVYQEKTLLVFVDRFFLKGEEKVQIDLPEQYKGKYREVLSGDQVIDPKEFKHYALFLKS